MRVFSSKLLSYTGETDWKTAKPDSNLGVNNWRDITYGNNKFVALGYNGHISTSGYGTNWTSAIDKIESGSSGSWVSIAYTSDFVGYGVNYVALGQSGSIAVSAKPAEIWNSYGEIANLGSRNWSAITYGGGRFVALSQTGYVSFSTNGTDWRTAVQVENLGSNFWRAITYGNNKFVAISQSKDVSNSPDGIGWQSSTRNIDFPALPQSICFDGEKFIVLGYNGAISTSIDGVNWTPAVQNDELGEHNWMAISYGNNKLVALGEDGYISSKRV